MQTSLFEVEPGTKFVQPRSSVKQRFASPYAEVRGEPISFRLPRSLDVALRSRVGWRSKADNPKLKAAIENALVLWLAGNEEKN